MSKATSFSRLPLPLFLWPAAKHLHVLCTKRPRPASPRSDDGAAVVGVVVGTGPVGFDHRDLGRVLGAV